MGSCVQRKFLPVPPQLPLAGGLRPRFLRATLLTCAPPTSRGMSAAERLLLFTQVTHGECAGIGGVVIIYRTTSGRVIDLWSFTPHHLAVASRLAAVVQQSAEAESRPTEEALRAELLRSLSLLGIGQDTSIDDALRAFVLDLAPRWLSSTERPSTSKGMTTLSWRAHLRSRIVAALGLEERGGKTTVANQLGADPSREAGSSTPCGGRLTQPSSRGLISSIKSNTCSTFASSVWRWKKDFPLESSTTSADSPWIEGSSFRIGKAGSFSLPADWFDSLSLSKKTSEYRVDWSDLAWSLGVGETDEFAVEGLAKNIARLFGINAPAASCSVLHIPERYCSDPDVRPRFTSASSTAHGHLPVVEILPRLHAPNPHLRHEPAAIHSV